MKLVKTSYNAWFVKYNDPSKSILPWYSVTVSCGGEKLYPDCTYCPTSHKSSEDDGCNGNCMFDLEKGECKRKGKGTINIDTYHWIALPFLFIFMNITLTFIFK